MPPKKLDPKIAALLRKKGYRIQVFYWITTKDKGLIRFFPNKAQKHYFLNRTKRNIILKSRQLGFTTFACIDMLDDALFSPNFNGILIAQDDTTMQEIFDKVHLAWLNHPLRSQYEIDTQRANQLKVGFLDGHNGESKSFSSIIVKQSGRSGMYHHIHISEFGKICAKYPHKVKEILTGTFPSSPLDGKITIESTAEGENNKFHEMFWIAWNRPKEQPHRPTDFKAFFYNWQWDTQELKKVTQIDAQIPTEFLDYQAKHNEQVTKYKEKHLVLPYWLNPIDDLQLTYYYYKWLQTRDWKLHLQEYPTTPEEAFISSGQKFFDMDKVEKMKKYIKEPTTINNWNYFYPFEQGHTYGMAADPAGGVGRDACAAVIMDFTPIKPRVVATYQDNKIPPDVFAHELKDAAAIYNFPLLAVENNSYGLATITKLKEIYPDRNLYKQVKEDFEEDKETERIGWNTNRATKPKMLYDIRTAVNDELIEIPSEQLIHECRTYDSNDLQIITAKEDQTKHWDLLISLAICYQLCSQLHQSTQRVIVTNSRTKSRSNLNNGI